MCGFGGVWVSCLGNAAVFVAVGVVMAQPSDRLNVLQIEAMAAPGPADSRLVSGKLPEGFLVIVCVPRG